MGSKRLYCPEEGSGSSSGTSAGRTASPTPWYKMVTCLPKRCFCWSLRTGTIIQGALCIITVTINILAVTVGLSEIMKFKIYLMCWPLEKCFDDVMAFEKSLILSNIVVNALLFIFSTLLLSGVKNERQCQLIPFMFVQGLMISGLMASAITACVICFQEGTWSEFISVIIFSVLYISLQIYMALVIRAYCSQIRKNKMKVKTVTKCEQGENEKEKYREMTLEDFVFS